MKLTTKLCLLLCMSALFLLGCKSTQKAETSQQTENEPLVESSKDSAEPDEDYAGPKPEYSKHVAIQNTKSKVVKKAQKMHLELTATELTKLMGNGINLSNTMEAYRGWMKSTTKDATFYEQLWGQPVTTQELMDGFKTAGFDSIRIPVAWTNAIDFEHGDYTINKSYLDRVETIVNYALKANLIVMINDHWDGGWWGMFGSADEQTRKDAMELYTSMWTQIANRFKNYSDYLIFEGGNEEIGSRLNDVNACYDSNTLSDDECYETANKINQTFVDIIRATGGNNKNRFLLIPGCNTNFADTCDERFKMPTDTAKSKLLVSVHYYDPWVYCGGASVTHWGTTSELGDQNSKYESIASFVENGYGVVIGEYGVACKKDGTKKDNMCDWLSNILDNCDYYNYCPMLWDTNTFFKRDQCCFPDPEVAAVYKDRNYASESKMTVEEIQTKAENSIEDRMDNSPAVMSDNPFVGRNDISVAWIMFNGNDWNTAYSVGDSYYPDSKTDGIKATDVQITGKGTYTAALDFTGTEVGYAVSTAFSALGISNGERLFPNYIVTIKEILINGKSYTPKGLAYTTSDDKNCTRVNLYNGWVKKIPKEARVNSNEDISKASAAILDPKDAELQKIKTISVTFDYAPAK